MKGRLVGFDGHTIYRVNIEEQNHVVRVKHLRIFEDTVAKQSCSLPDFEGKPMFDAIRVEDGSTTDSKEEEPPSPKKKATGRQPTAMLSQPPRFNQLSRLSQLRRLSQPPRLGQRPCLNQPLRLNHVSGLSQLLCLSQPPRLSQLLLQNQQSWLNQPPQEL